MSSREHLTKLMKEALHSYFIEQSWDDAGGAAAEAAPRILNAVMPLIVEPRQMRGVPEGSILIVLIQAGARALRWEDGHLHGNLRADQMPMTPGWVIGRYGPLTVVWMP